MAMLKLKSENDLFDEISIDTFFQNVFPRIPEVEYKNPLGCVLAYYICISEKIQFKMDESKLNYIQEQVVSSQDILFQNSGLKLPDLVRYIRLYETTFSP